MRIVLFVRLRDGLTLDDTLRDKIRTHHPRQHDAAPRARASIMQAPDLPRTINGKLVELAVREVVHGRAVKNLDALANPQALDFFKDLPELQDVKVAELYQRECATPGLPVPILRRPAASSRCSTQLREQLIAAEAEAHCSATSCSADCCPAARSTSCNAGCTCGAASAAARPG